MKKINIDKTENATFCNTLSTELNLAKNTAYVPMFKLAFDAFINEIGSDYVIRDKTLQVLNNYKFHQNPLKENEYKKVIEKKDNELNIEVSFNKDLPFEDPSKISEEPLIFEGEKLCHFKPRLLPDLLYYKNEDDFAISLIPKDESQEIIMLKSPFSSNSSFEDTFQTLQQYKGLKSVDFNAEIKIPIIELDWSTNHPEIEKRRLEKSPLDYWDLTKVEEGLNFSLTNTGAKVKAYHKLEGKWNCVVPENPHQTIFDKPFMIFLKKEDATTPYFAAYIADPTFLRKFDLNDIIEENNKLF